jgi:hypothetical protein
MNLQLASVIGDLSGLTGQRIVGPSIVVVVCPEATMVTLGQALSLKNLQTQDEAGAWVTRLGLPHGAWTQVGIEFVRPDEGFWGTRPQSGSDDAGQQLGIAADFENPDLHCHQTISRSAALSAATIRSLRPPDLRHRKCGCLGRAWARL